FDLFDFMPEIRIEIQTVADFVVSSLVITGDNTVLNRRPEPVKLGVFQACFLVKCSQLTEIIQTQVGIQVHFQVILDFPFNAGAKPELSPGALLIPRNKTWKQENQRDEKVPHQFLINVIVPISTFSFFPISTDLLTASIVL